MSSSTLSSSETMGLCGGYTNANFYTGGGYKNVIKRMEKGIKNTEDLAQALHHRIKIEKQYASELKQWAVLNEKLFGKQPEHESLQRAYLAFFKSADSLAQHHLAVVEAATAVLSGLNAFIATSCRKDKFSGTHKGVSSCTKEFSKIQKRWDVLTADLYVSKKTVAAKTKDHQKALTDFKTAEADPKKAEKISKYRDTLQSAMLDEERSQRGMETCYAQLQNEAPRLEHEMNAEFHATQDIESHRIMTIRDHLIQASDALNIFTIEGVSNGFAEAVEAAYQVDEDAITSEFARLYVEPYTVDLPADSTNYEKVKSTSTLLMSAPGGPAAIVRTSTSEVSGPSASPVSRISSAPQSRLTSVKRPPTATPPSSPPPPPAVAYVVALYDFDATSSEELSFAVGERLTLLVPEDVNGWIYAEKANNERGYIPANYVDIMA